MVVTERTKEGEKMYIESNPGLTLLILSVKTENGALYKFSIDRRNTKISPAGDDNWYRLIQTGPIAIGLELRGTYETNTHVIKFESPDKVVDIIAQFHTNMRNDS